MSMLRLAKDEGRVLMDAGVAPPARKLDVASALLGLLVMTSVPIVLLAPHALSWLPVLFIAPSLLVLRYRLGRYMHEADKVPLALVAAFLCWSLLCCFWAPDRDFALQNVAAAVLSAAVVYASVLLGRANAPAPGSQFWGMLVTHVVLVVALFAISEGWVNPAIIRGERTDVVWTSWAYNRAAIMTVMFMPVTFLAIERLWPGRRGFVVGAIWLAGCAALVFRSASETAMLAFLVMVPFHVLSRWSIPQARRLLVLGTAVLALSVPFVVSLLERPLKALPFIQEFRPGTILARLEVWWHVANKIELAPLLGYGVEAMRTELYHSDHYRADFQIGHPHSVLFQLWSDLGILGVLLFIAVTGFVAVNMARNTRPLAAVQLTTLAVTLTVAAVSHGMWQNWWFGLVGIVFMTVRAVAASAQAEILPQAPASRRLGRMVVLRGLGAALARMVFFVIIAVAALFIALTVRGGLDFARPIMPPLSTCVLGAALAAQMHRLIAADRGETTARGEVLGWLTSVLLTVSLFALLAALGGVITLIPRSIYLILPALMLLMIFSWEFVAANLFPNLSLRPRPQRDERP
jgi:O-antigen ligase